MRLCSGWGADYGFTRQSGIHELRYGSGITWNYFAHNVDFGV
jgi:hypothetical protein